MGAGAQLCICISWSIGIMFPLRLAMIAPPVAHNIL
jgi:hypothetical protein